MFICVLNICVEFRTLQYVNIFLLYRDYFTRFIASDRHIQEAKHTLVKFIHLSSTSIHPIGAQCHTVRQVFNSCISNTRSAKHRNRISMEMDGKHTCFALIKSLFRFSSPYCNEFGAHIY